MAHEVKWLIENRIILNKYINILDMEDIRSVSEMSLSMISDVPHTVHVLADLSELAGIHSEFNRLPELLKQSRSFMSEPNLGAIVAYGSDNKILEFLGSMVIQIARKNWQFYATHEEAIKYLMHIDPTLAPELETLLSLVTDD